MGVKQVGPHPDRGENRHHRHAQRQALPAQSQEHHRRRDQEGRIGDGVQRLGPVRRIGAFAIAVDCLRPIHVTAPANLLVFDPTDREDFMKIIWLGHSGFRIEIAGQVLLVDPWLTGNPMFPEGRRPDAIGGPRRCWSRTDTETIRPTPWRSGASLACRSQASTTS
jgi:hypothetical protein